jgi:hypothetical protein
MNWLFKERWALPLELMLEALRTLFGTGPVRSRNTPQSSVLAGRESIRTLRAQVLK